MLKKHLLPFLGRYGTIAVLTPIFLAALTWLVDITCTNALNTRFSPELINSLSSIFSSLYIVFFFWAILGVLFIIFDGYAREFWNNIVKPLIETRLNEIKSETSIQLKNHHNETRNILLLEKLNEAIDKSDNDSLKFTLPRIQRKIFGPHADNEFGLIHYCSKTFNNFYDAETPHRSKYRKNISLKPHDESSFEWNEINKYRIHCLGLNSQLTKDVKPQCTYPLVYHSESLMAFSTLEEFTDAFRLIIKVDGKELFNSTKHFIIDNGELKCRDTEIDILKAFKIDNDRITIKLEKEITLTEEWTSIEVIESSILKDTNFILNTGLPTCEADIYISIPDGWIFEDVVLAETSNWEIIRNTKRVLDAHTNDWVLPGITGVVSWAKEPPQPDNFAANAKKAAE